MAPESPAPKPRRKFPYKLAAVAVLAVAAFVLGLILGGPSSEPPADHAAHQGDQTADMSGMSNMTGSGAPASKDENVIWTCSMHPSVQLPEPGQCPICFMDLIPVKKGGGSGSQQQISLRQISLTPEARALAEIETAEVVRRQVDVTRRLYGKVDYDESRQGIITAWMAGRIDKLYIDTTGAMVRRGQAMASIYSPELLTAQAELIQAVKTVEELKNSQMELVKESARTMVKASREKLRLLGLSQARIDDVVKRGTPSDHITLTAPMSGIVIKKSVVEGVYVKTGAEIYAIADLSKVWVVLEAYETDLPWIRVGQKVSFTSEAFPGKVFTGQVIFIEPTVDRASRTVKVRLEVANPDIALKPGMFVTAELASRPSEKNEGETAAKGKIPPALVIPATAPLITGKRAIVYVAVPDDPGVYVGREVVLGPRAGDFYVVKNGLSEGELVVTKGNFKIDSALQIMARPSMMSGDTKPAGPPPMAGMEGMKMGGKEGSSGGMEGMEGMSGAEAKKAGARFEVPQLFESKLALVRKNYEAVKAWMQAGDLPGAHESAQAMADNLANIDASDLTGDAKLTWNELSMLLSNDAVLLADAADVERLKFVFGETQKHFDRLAQNFPVSGGEQLPAPDEFKRQLAELFKAYQPLAVALSKDDLNAAKKAAAEVAAALRGVDMGLLSQRAHTVWMRSQQEMSQGLEAMREASDITSMRAGFEPVSIGLRDAIAKFGAATNEPVYELACPMAFDNKGALWLQTDQEVKNPYFGSAMFRCGEVTRQLQGDK